MTLVFTIALTVLFIHATTWRGMIFHSINRLNIPVWLAKPLFACPVCMTPYYGAAILFLLNKQLAIESIFTIAAAAGINVFSIILITWYEKMEDEADKEERDVMNFVNHPAVERERDELRDEPKPEVQEVSERIDEPITIKESDWWNKSLNDSKTLDERAEQLSLLTGKQIKRVNEYGREVLKTIK